MGVFTTLGILIGLFTVATAVIITFAEVLGWFRSQKNALKTNKLSSSEELIFTTQIKRGLKNNYTLVQGVFTPGGGKYVSRRVVADEIEEELKDLHDGEEIYVHTIS